MESWTRIFEEHEEQTRAALSVLPTDLRQRAPPPRTSMTTRHVLRHATLLNVIQRSWNTLWTTKVGRVPLHAFSMDAQVIGKFFQELMTHELHAEDPRWRHPDAPRSSKDPDFVFTEDPAQSFELKMCGQAGGRAVFGNRCSSASFASPRGKSRDSWLLTINYTDTRINLVRFGFVLGSDWIGQVAASGNASRLHPAAYAEKLRVVRGEYQRLADPRILRGVGKSTRFATVGQAAEAKVQEALTFLAASHY
jgi:hypothetical protein